MSVKQCVEQLLEIETKRQEGAYGPKTRCYGLARIGFGDQQIIAAEMEKFLQIDLGAPLHSLVICSDSIHSMEKEMYDFYTQ